MPIGKDGQAFLISGFKGVIWKDGNITLTLPKDSMMAILTAATHIDIALNEASILKVREVERFIKARTTK